MEGGRERVARRGGEEGVGRKEEAGKEKDKGIDRHTCELKEEVMGKKCGRKLMEGRK